MANMSNYLQNKLIDFLFRSGSYAPPSILYVALCTVSPDDTSTGSTLTEVSGGNYSRQPVTCNATNWSSTQGDTSSTSSGANGTTLNQNIIAWNSVTWTATVNSVAICDAASGGNVLWWGTLSLSKSVSSSDSISFSPGDLSIQVDN